MLSLPRDAVLEDPNALLIMADFQMLVDVPHVSSMGHPSSFGAAKRKVPGKVTRVLCFHKESKCFPSSLVLNI